MVRTELVEDYQLQHSPSTMAALLIQQAGVAS
jgi:hypothetical protein